MAELVPSRSAPPRERNFSISLHRADTAGGFDLHTASPRHSWNSLTSSKVAPPVENPVEVLIKSAPEASTIWHILRFSSSVSRRSR